VPLGAHDKVEPGVFTANFYDEVFLNFGDSQRLDYIQQNRISALLGYQVNRAVQRTARVTSTRPSSDPVRPMVRT
jgi:hypothetical protein